MVPYKTIPPWAIVFPLPGALMYLASPRASPPWTSSTGKEYTQAAGQRSVVHEQDEGIGFTDLLRIRMHSFFSFGVLCLVPSAELLRGTY
jgi:hypothetical protein